MISGCLWRKEFTFLPHVQPEHPMCRELGPEVDANFYLLSTSRRGNREMSKRFVSLADKTIKWAKCTRVTKNIFPYRTQFENMIFMKYIFPLSDESFHRIRFFPEFSDGKKANKTPTIAIGIQVKIFVAPLPMVHWLLMAFLMKMCAIIPDIEKVVREKRLNSTHKIF